MCPLSRSFSGEFISHSSTVYIVYIKADNAKMGLQLECALITIIFLSIKLPVVSGSNGYKEYSYNLLNSLTDPKFYQSNVIPVTTESSNVSMTMQLQVLSIVAVSIYVYSSSLASDNDINNNNNNNNNNNITLMMMMMMMMMVMMIIMMTTTTTTRTRTTTKQ